MRSGSNKTFEILSNGIVKFFKEMGIFWQLHFSFGRIFYLQFQCEIWGLMNLSVHPVMLQCSDKLEGFFFLR